MRAEAIVATDEADLVTLAETPFPDIARVLFPPGYELIPNVMESYELQLAYGESRLLSATDLSRRGAYFMRVGGATTDLFRLSSGAPLVLPEATSGELRAFFKRNLYRTGYATHGLFPYKGKFHPQMVRALINIMGLKPGDLVLDPMSGSGTTLVEAGIMGVRSVGVDVSPFCALMGRAKVAALHAAQEKFDQASGAFIRAVANRWGQVVQHTLPVDRASVVELLASQPCEIAHVLELAYLDALGYSARTRRATLPQLLAEVVERYSAAIGKFERARAGMGLSIADADAIVGDARAMELADEAVDGAIFSPPYSFAIDYLQNDTLQLQYLDVRPADLRNSMIGLRGRTVREQIGLYLEDMRRVVKEVARVLRPARFATIVVGSNTKQLSSALRVKETEVKGLESHLLEFAQESGLVARQVLERPIHGLSNTLRHEYVIILQKEARSMRASQAGIS